MRFPNLMKYLAVVMLAAIALTGCSSAEEENMRSSASEQLLRPKTKSSVTPDSEAAYEYYIKTLERDPDNGAARAALADILEKRGDLIGAEAQIDNALAIDSRNADWLRTKGKLQIRQNRYEAARETFVQAVEVAPNDSRALNGLGVSLDHLGRHAAAQIIYRRALDNKSEDFASLSNLGRSLVLSGDYVTAIKVLEPYAMRKEAPAALRHNLAEAYGLSGMMIDAERILRIEQTRSQAAQTLAGYKQRKTNAKQPPAPYLDLGRYPTMAMAESKRDQILSGYATNGGGVVLTVLPEISAIGETPKFAIRGTGFASMYKARTYCEGIKARGISCTLHSGQ